MGLFDIIFGKKEEKPYKPPVFPANDRTILITAKHNAMLSVHNEPFSKIEGTVTEFKQNKNEVNIKNLEGILFISKEDNGFIDVVCEGTLQGDWYYSGNIEAKTVHLTIRKPMKLNILAQIVSAQGFTNLQNYYLPTHLLPEKLREFDTPELTPEEINGSYITINTQADKLETTRILARTVNLNYLPFENDEEE